MVKKLRSGRLFPKLTYDRRAKRLVSLRGPDGLPEVRGGSGYLSGCTRVISQARALDSSGRGCGHERDDGGSAGGYASARSDGIRQRVAKAVSGIQKSHGLLVNALRHDQWAAEDVRAVVGEFGKEIEVLSELAAELAGDPSSCNLPPDARRMRSPMSRRLARRSPRRCGNSRESSRRVRMRTSRSRHWRSCGGPTACWMSRLMRL